jgi:hypothetical protein
MQPLPFLLVAEKSNRQSETFSPDIGATAPTVADFLNPV